MLALGNQKHPNARGEKPATSYLKELMARETKRKVQAMPSVNHPSKQGKGTVVVSHGNNNNKSPSQQAGK